MNNTIKILIILGLIVFIALVSYAVFSRSDKPASSASTMSIKNKEGKEIKVPNFVDTAVLNYQNTPILESNDSFTIQYDFKNNVFQIFLNIVDAADLDTYRIDAETLLANRLNKSLSDLCDINIVETVRDNGIVDLPIYNYGPSVCDNK